MSISEAAAWDGVAQAYEASFENLTLQYARHTLNALPRVAHARLLDVAAGAGGLALMAAQEHWHVTAIDFSPVFVARIQERATLAGMSPAQVEALIMDGTNMTFDDNTFDAVCSVFGVMMFTERYKAYKEIIRVLRPGGTVAVAIWGEPQHNESQTLMFDAMAQIGLAPPSPPPWGSLTATGAGERELRNFGLTSTRTRTVAGHWDVPSVSWLWQAIPRISPVSAMLLKGLNESDLAHLRDTYITLATSRHGNGPFTLSSTAHIITGNKPNCLTPAPMGKTEAIA